MLLQSNPRGKQTRRGGYHRTPPTTPAVLQAPPTLTLFGFRAAAARSAPGVVKTVVCLGQRFDGTMPKQQKLLNDPNVRLSHTMNTPGFPGPIYGHLTCLGRLVVQLSGCQCQSSALMAHCQP